MRKKICIALMTAFTVLLGVSSYFIIDHYKEAEEQTQMHDSLAQIVKDSEKELSEPIPYSEDKTILPELSAVSYTHLDVYKRQPSASASLRNSVTPSFL